MPKKPFVTVEELHKIEDAAESLSGDLAYAAERLVGKYEFPSDDPRKANTMPATLARTITMLARDANNLVMALLQETAEGEMRK